MLNVFFSNRWISEKYDGVRGLWVGEKGERVFFSKGGRILPLPFWILDSLPGLPLDGELWYKHAWDIHMHPHMYMPTHSHMHAHAQAHIFRFYYCRYGMGAQIEVSVAMQPVSLESTNWDRLNYVIFDTPSQLPKVTYMERYNILKRLFDNISAGK